MNGINIGHFSDPHVTIATSGASQVFGDAPGYRIFGFQQNSLPLFIATCNDNDVDIAVNTGDSIHGPIVGPTEQVVADNFREYVDYIDGTKDGTALDAEILHSIGHWDIPAAVANPVFINNYFTVSSGIGSLQPAGLTNAWWPDSPAVDDNALCSYTYDKNGFRFINVCTPLGGVVTMESAGKNGAENQNSWFKDRVEQADAAGIPIVVMTHVPFNTSIGNPIPGASSAISVLEAANQKPVVLQGHVHSDADITDDNDVLYINMRGDLWDLDENNKDRFSHAIVSILPNAVWDGSKKSINVRVQGFGSSGEKAFDEYFIG